MMFEDMGSTCEEISQRCALPGVRSISCSSSGPVDLGDDRKLPPLPRVEPLPRGPFNPFTSNIFAPSPPSSQDTFPVKSPWPVSEQIVTPPSPANSADSSWPESLTPHKSFEWPQELSAADLLNLIAPKNISRKPPLQQLCGRKRKGSMISVDVDDQREKHRIAEGNRRKNLSQLHRELDSRIHDFFLERAGWNPAKSLPESKEHIVQGAIFLIDFMLLIIIHLIRQENEMPRQLSEKLQPQIRCMQLQQLVNNLQQQNQAAQQQIKALKQENQLLEERNQALEFQLKSYEHMFRSPKSEQTSPRPITQVPEAKAHNVLPGLRMMCDGMPTASSGPEPFHAGTSHSQSYGHAFLSTTPPMTGPPSPVFPHSAYSVPHSRRQSMIPSP
ncbi:putative HLH DNA binding domain protein [Aspergillus clavatus NRRL 1]|uniref:HLH DNA binding domain protein, putative n=1 Tax=Aspergillus clavatus (strain ATCC 1007 / CBS 513.65 / DSM 816 / NCTC 3887 / NRRL 1 / QM 1276 / 107) TaxID=344612 RepID=A1CGZ6_ASPCL|nr:HLH DNA binding domain protein, putative [Aspergillus clavatus NRRL 1]EAW10151.1 HLH DNA binding domain protein, putative [Aspergillus clavatus NRRL 1]